MNTCSGVTIGNVPELDLRCLVIEEGMVTTSTAVEVIFREVFKVTSTIGQKHFSRIIETILALLGNGPDNREDITLGAVVLNLSRVMGFFFEKSAL